MIYGLEVLHDQLTASKSRDTMIYGLARWNLFAANKPTTGSLVVLLVPETIAHHIIPYGDVNIYLEPYI
ncbi:hypothetical protein ATG_18210 [Desulfurococcaceae archaeon AG1]|jgi:hypothetical protein|nr:MAG: hypothetical protein DJ555_04305 [Desulfurococcaceae archaeon]GAY26617.1 hypothetical protein ATG_18210 [Desulfurococcaceae archaeon AG1]